MIIYNILGQRVATLADEIQSAGYKSIQWNGSDLASGVYLYRIEAVSITDKHKSFTQVKKMILLR
jgi:flagellar hook assembly protein FlgD